MDILYYSLLGLMKAFTFAFSIVKLEFAELLLIGPIYFTCELALFFTCERQLIFSSTHGSLIIR